MPRTSVAGRFSKHAEAHSNPRDIWTAGHRPMEIDSVEFFTPGVAEIVMRQTGRRGVKVTLSITSAGLCMLLKGVTDELAREFLALRDGSSARRL